MRGVGFQNKLLCSRFENDSFAHTSTVCTNTQQVAGHGQVITVSRPCVITAADSAGSKRIATKRFAALSESMATVIVENEFVKVNTAMPDHPGSCPAMKVLLQSAALNCDMLSLGMDHEAEMLSQAYTGVSTQCAASVSLSHADAKTSALLQLADLSDEGLGKLSEVDGLCPSMV